MLVPRLVAAPRTADVRRPAVAATPVNETTGRTPDRHCCTANLNQLQMWSPTRGQRRNQRRRRERCRKEQDFAQARINFTTAV